ncbi:MAG TPA: MBL fold metallo-hydrolase [Armatimonadota bacterium]
MSINVRSYILGSYPIRGFLAWAAGDSQALFVDPGGWDEAITETLAEHELTVTAIVLTHGHWDHTGGVAEAAARLQAPIYIHQADAPQLDYQPLTLLHGGENLPCGSLEWRVLHVPGHTAGCLAYTTGDVLFTGDTLFAGSLGGTASLEAHQQELRGIREQLFPLGDATRVYPAHGPASTIGVERRCNPFLR